MAQLDEILEHPDTGPTEPDEEAVLRDLYGPADADGVYTGQGS